jgi:hypothetical protein
MLDQKSQLAAGGVVNGGERSSDEEVQQDAQNVGSGASRKSLPAEQACGDYEWNAVTEEDESLDEVRRSGRLRRWLGGHLGYWNACRK